MWAGELSQPEQRHSGLLAFRTSRYINAGIEFLATPRWKRATRTTSVPQVFAEILRLRTMRETTARDGVREGQMGWHTPEPRTLEVHAIHDRERTRNGNWYLPCETSDGVAVFWGSNKNFDNIESIEAGRVPFTVTCDCISSNWSRHDLWVPENSRVEVHAPEAAGDAEDDSVATTEQGSPPLHEGTIDAKFAESWMEAMELVDPRFRGLLRSFFRRRVPTPVVGYELVRGTGAVLAESELAWPARKIAVVLAERPEWKASFEKADWRVFEGDAEKLGEAVAAALDV